MTPDWTRTLVARGAARLQRRHLRWRAEQAGGGRLHCFLLDVSASMLAHGRLALAKGVVLALAQQAYQRRERVALLCFQAGRVELVIAPGRAGRWPAARVAPIGGGGGTSLVTGLQQAQALLDRERRRARQQACCLWLLTDGRFPERPLRPEAADEVRVVDFEDGRLRLGRAAELARDWGAEYLLAGDLAAQL